MLKRPLDIKKSVDLNIIENRRGLITPSSIRTVLKDIIDYAADAPKYLVTADVQSFLLLLDDIQAQVQVELNKELSFEEAIYFRSYIVYIQNGSGLAANLSTPQGKSITLELGTYVSSESQVIVVNDIKTNSWRVIFHSQTTIQYSNAQAMPSTLGGLTAGTTFTNEDLYSILDRLLYPYQTPQLSLNSNLTRTTYEVGESILESPDTLQFSYVATNLSNLDSVYIYRDNTAISPALDPGETYTYPITDYTVEPIRLVAAGSVSWVAKGLDTSGADITSSNLTINWRHRTFVGWSVNLVEDIADLTVVAEVLSKPSSASKPATAQESYLYVFLPVSYGAYTRFKSNGIDVVMADVETVTLSRLGVDVSYYVYRVFNKSFGAYLLEMS